jgi:Ca2+-binding RTX toxin-like protein
MLPRSSDCITQKKAKKGKELRRLKFARSIYRPSLERLEDRTLLTGPDYSMVKQGLDGVLGGLQAAASGRILGIDIPIVGAALKDSTEAKFFDAFKTSIDAAMGTAPASADDVKNDLNTALGISAPNTITIDSTDPNDVKFKVHLEKTDSAVSTGAFKFDIGLPGLGLTTSSAGGLTVQLSYKFDLNFGVSSTDGFYFDTSAFDATHHELTVGLKITMPGLNTSGTLGFLQIAMNDGGLPNSGLPGSSFNPSFAFDVTPTGNKLALAQLPSFDFVAHSNASINGEAVVNLGVVVGFADVSPGVPSQFPSVKANLHLDWNMNSADTKAATLGSAPTVQFNQVQLDIGTFLSNFVDPVLGKIQTVLKPLQPVIDFLQAPIPVISDLIGHKFTLLDLAGISDPTDVAFIKSIAQVVTLIDSIPTDGGNVAIQFGNFDLGAQTDVRTATASVLQSLNIASSPFADVLDHLDGPLADDAKAFLAGLEGPDSGGLTFPIMNDPAAVFGLFLGKPVDLFHYTMPDLHISSSFNEFFPILGPLGVRLKGTGPNDAALDLTAHAEFGYDIYGLTHGNPLEGFFVQHASVKLTGGLEADAELNVVVAQAGVGGGITANVDFELHDPSAADDAGTDKVRPSEIVTDLQMGPLCIFTISGSLDAFLHAYIKVGFDSPFGFVGWSDDFSLADTKLLDFSAGCGGGPVPTPPDFGDIDPSLGDGVLRLNVGPYSFLRGSGDTADDDENFTVTHVSGDATDETVDISAFGATKRVEHVKKIYAEGGAGNNIITIKKGVLASTEIWGGFNPNSTSTATRNAPGGTIGNNILSAGDGPTTLHGGNGNDRLIAGGGNDFLYGEGGDDNLIGGPGNNYLDGGAGNNQLKGGSGVSTLYGGNGSATDVNLLQAGTGDDDLRGGNGPNTFVVNNPSGSVLASHGPGIRVRGNGILNKDRLVISGGGGDGFTETYTYGPGNGDGSIVTTNGTTTQNISYTGLAPIIDSVVAGSVAINANSSSNQIQISDANLSADVNPGANEISDQGGRFTRIQVDSFEKTYLSNKPVINVYGLGGGDTVYLNDLHPDVKLTNLNVYLGTGSNTVNVYSTAANVATKVDGTQGSNAFYVGSSHVDQSNSVLTTVPAAVDKISGALTLEGAGPDTLNVDDSGSTIDKSGTKSGTLTSTTLSGLGMGGAITYSGLATLNINLGKGADHLTVNSTQAGATNIDGGPGNDTIDLLELDGPTIVHGGNDSDTITLHASKIVGPVQLFGDAGDDHLIVNQVPVGTVDLISLDGGAGTDTYEVDITGAGGYVVHVQDSGGGHVDTLTVNGTDQADNFLLRANSGHTSGFVAALHGVPVALVERINYDTTIGFLVVNMAGGNDSATLDDNLAPTTINGGQGNDHFQVGQIFNSLRDFAHAKVASGDEFATTQTTRGYLSNGISYPSTLHGNFGNDDFTVFHNTAALTLDGDEDDDTFAIRAFAKEGSTDTTIGTGSGVNLVQYVINAKIHVDGGSGTNTLRIIGTEFADKFVITDHGIYGAGLMVDYTNIQNLEVDGAEGDDQFYVLSTGQPNANNTGFLDLTLYGGLGNDSFYIAGDSDRVVTGITGAAIAYTGTGTSNSTDTLTVSTADLNDAMPQLITNLSDLVGDQIEITSGPGQGRAWTITGVAPGATQTVLTMQSPANPNAALGLPNDPSIPSNYAISAPMLARVGPHTLNVIRGPLHLQGGAGQGSAGGLGQAVMLPNETNQLASDGTIVSFNGTGTSLSVDTMTVPTAALQAALANQPAPNGSLNDLVNRTIQISNGPGLNRFWLITNLSGDTTNTVLTLRSPGQPAQEWGLPNATSSFALTHLSPNFFVSENDTLDKVMVFNDLSTSNDVGTLSATAINGLGMSAAGITYADMETLEILLGRGNDTFTVTSTAPNAITAVHGDGGDDHLYATGGGGMNSPLLLYGDTTQDRHLFQQSSGQPWVHPAVGYGFAFPSDGNDTIDASADTQSVAIYGGGGNDTIYGSQAGDQLAGGAGNDEIHGGPGDDHIYGDSGFNEDLSTRRDKVISANVQILQVVTTETAGNDNLFGDDGNDIVFGDHGIITQVPGTQRIFTTSNVTRIETTNAANFGSDSVQGGGGDDVLMGGSGADRVSGGDGNDIAFGDNGLITYVTNGNIGNLALPDLIQSTLPTMGDVDTVYGNAGNDILLGGTGGDLIYGGNGVGNAPVVGSDSDIVLGDNGELDQVTSRTPQQVGSIQTTDTTNATGGNDVIEGNEGDDILIGGAGNDRIDGNQGQDLILGDNGRLVSRPIGMTADPRVRVLAGSLLYDAAGNALVTGPWQTAPGAAAQWANYLVTLDDGSTGVFGDDYLAGGQGNDMVFGQAGNDTIQGDGSIRLDVGSLGNIKSSVEDFDHVDSNTGLPVSVVGNDGDDYIEGGAGNDLVFGGLGQDDIIGGSSDLFGLATPAQRGDGNDVLFGGAGTRTARNDPGDASASGHARDADYILGDNGDIFRLVGTGGVSMSHYLTFNYDNYGAAKIIPRVIQTLDYTPGVAGASDIGGADVIHGEAGDDFIHGETGNDVLAGDGQDDQIIGGAGNDRIYGGTGEDSVLGDDGRFVISRNGLNEPLYGVTTVNAQTNITLPGPFTGAWTYITGRINSEAHLLAPTQGGNDLIYGGTGDDFIHGGAGDDALSGAEAQAAWYNDMPVGAAYYVHGGYSVADPSNPLGYNPATRKLAAYDAVNPFTKISNFFLNFDAATDPNNAAATKIDDGTDRVFGDDGNDWLVGGTDNDRLFGGKGDDLMNADDNLDTNGGLNNQPDAPAFADRDFVYGGDGLDVMIANTGGDRMFDWSGEFNSYLVPFSAFGEPTVYRAPSPNVQAFLLGLGQESGADPTMVEPNGELGLFTQKDPQWGANRGAPRDPQPGNIGGTQRDTQGGPEDDRGTALPLAGALVTPPAASSVATNSTDVTFNKIYVSTDPSNPAQLALFVAGGSGNDNILVQPGKTAAYLDVVMNKVDLGQFAITSSAGTIGRIIIYGNDGNDTITVNPNITIDVAIYGGAGNDTITAGGGSAYIDGGIGNDVITGGAGRSVLVGGLGKDTLTGGGADDILIGGSYEYSNDLDSVFGVMAIWKDTTQSYAQRLSALRAGGPLALFEMDNNSILSDGAVDALFGNGGQDWFWAFGSFQSDRKSNETLN